MKPFQKRQKRTRERGYAAIPMVIFVTSLVLVGLIAIYRETIRSQEVAAKSQVQVDYIQKEDALLRALVAIVPNRAIGAMQPGEALDNRLT